MKYLTVSQWKRREFDEDSQPQNRTVREWIKNRQIIGAFIGRMAYVRADQKVSELNDIDNAVNELIEMSA
jgi:hypothetical protein